MRRPRDLPLERRSGGLRLPGATKRTFFCLFTSFSMFCFHRELLRRSEHVRPSVCLSSTDLERLLSRPSLSKHALNGRLLDSCEAARRLSPSSRKTAATHPRLHTGARVHGLVIQKQCVACKHGCTRRLKRGGVRAGGQNRAASRLLRAQLPPRCALGSGDVLRPLCEASLWAVRLGVSGPVSRGAAPRRRALGGGGFGQGRWRGQM